MSEHELMPDRTGSEQDTKFKAGQSGNPAGRPKGSKNKITKLFIDDLRSEWSRRGMQALRELTSNELTRTMVQVIPKDLLVTMDADKATSFVISAVPALTSEEWSAKHLESPSEAPQDDISDNEGHGKGKEE